MKIKEGDTIHICFEKYGEIQHFKIDRIKKSSGCDEYNVPSYQYLGVEKIDGQTNK